MSSPSRTGSLLRRWPWLVALLSLGVQALTFTNLDDYLASGWRALFWSPALLLPLLGLILALARPQAWREELRWPRAVVIAATATWMALSLAEFAQGLRDGYEFGRRMAEQERRAEGRPARDLPAPGPKAPVIPQGWGALLWVAFSAAGAYGLKRLEEARDEADRQRLQADLARDAALRAKLAPHFIFNTLNTLHAQIAKDPAEAQATTQRLAWLFRQVVGVADQLTVPLREELAFVEAYLGIEQARLGSRLQVVVEVPEDLEAQEIPPLSLQVLVENAIKHGVAPRELGGQVRVGARRSGDRLVVWVDDPGDGRGAGAGTGTALATLRGRLARPEDLELGPTPQGFRAAFWWKVG